MMKNQLRKTLFSMRASLTGLLMLFVAAASAQDITVRGSVKDVTGDPAVGATIRVQGSTTVGTVTDVNGAFTIVCSPNATLDVAYIGYAPQKVAVNGRSDISVVLNQQATDLSEVVVVGYGTQKKVNVTGAVSMVGSEVLEDRPVANASQALQGAVPGLNFTTNTNGGMLNNTMGITIRGTGTIGEGSVDAPLILIDGIEGDINALNPNDIESVSVLKDAAAASIYGTRAAFGVVLITTKSGKGGKVRVNYSGDVRFSTATQLPKMVSSLQFAEYFNAASINSGSGKQFSDEVIENMKKYMNGEFTDPTQPEYYGTTAASNGEWNDYLNAFANTNWFDEFYKKNVPSTQHNLSLSGGNDNISWLISGGYLQNNGLIRHGHDELDRYNLNAKINAKLAPWARVEYSTKWSRQNYEKPQYLEPLFFHNIARRWPTCPVVDPNGHWFRGMEIEELENGGLNKTQDNIFTQQLNFTFTPLEGWNIHLDGALRTDNYKETTSKIPNTWWNVNNEPSIRDSGYGTVTNYSDYRFQEDYYAVNIYTDYTRSFGKHNGKVLLGMNYEKWKQDWMKGAGENLTNSDYPFLSQTQSNHQATDTYWHRATAGYFGRLNYDYDGIYLFEFNLRYDGSSRFVGNKRWATFPSVSAGWNIARESFFQNWTDKISTLKLRASWGQLGNTSSNYNTFADWYPFYQQQAISSASSSWFINGQQQNVASMPGIANSFMTWETVESWNVGLDFAALNNRLTGSFDYYVRTTKDMIGPAPVLGSVLGVNAPRTNNCDMRSNGWELELAWRDNIGEFNYGAKLNISDATAEILNYPYDGAFENQSIGGYYNGKKLGEIWGYTTHGIAQSDEEMNEWIANNKPNWGGSWTAGDIMYTDLNGDNAVTPGAQTLADHGDLTVIGNTTPRYRFGLNLNAAWKGFDFSVFFQGVMKRDWWLGQGEAYFWGAQGNLWQSACFEEHLDYWSPENTSAYYPKPYLTGGIQKNQQTQTKYLQSAAYMRCKNIQLGYTLPQDITMKAGISRARVYFSCDNLFTLTSMSSIFDPEALSGGWGTGKLYPLQRTFAFGVNVTF